METPSKCFPSFPWIHDSIKGVFSSKVGTKPRLHSVPQLQRPQPCSRDQGVRPSHGGDNGDTAAAATTLCRQGAAGLGTGSPAKPKSRQKPKSRDPRVLEETANSSLQIPPVLSALQLWGASRKWRSRDGGPKSNLSRRIRPGIIWLRGCWLRAGSQGSARLGMSGRATIPQAWVGYAVINISEELGGIWRQNGLRLGQTAM